MGQQRPRYEQQAQAGTRLPLERFGPERPGPGLEMSERGRLPEEPLGPLFEQAAAGKQG
ncbi:hypothetical protein [Cyanobium sp. Morenito 9A2]|uniref:hypothetical protein n=1 Tax=Cyanobium sp. Morenito 9A2 TaxID=2823718 RepID=UPI0020CD6197|nr:hypothetical protein [Cyanobium sp. Morenito 9A2]MCP9848980.1 hypothetical protein [Cyanobium sp. Morenito 9A2]